MWLWRPIRRGPVLGVGLGLIVGGVEALGWALTAPVYPTIGGGIVWGLISVLLGGVVGAIAGLLGGAIAEWVVRAPELPARHAVAMAGAGFFLSGWHLWPMALAKLAQGLPIPAAALALTPIGVSGVVYFNAHYWLRREELGEERRIGWTAGALLFGTLLGVGAGLWLATRDQGSSKALDVDPHVLVITVEGLERTDLDAFTGSGLVATPRIDALAEKGVRFHEAISPMPESGPMHVALWTARHPVRVGVWSDEHVLGRSWATVPDVLRREGYATGAFVSTLTLGDHLGLARGFGVYDDDRWSGVLPAGTEELRVVQTFEDLAMRFLPNPGLLPRLQRRPDDETVERAESWMQRTSHRPQLVWVHLADLEGASAAERADRVRQLDDHVGRLVDALGPEEGGRPRLVVLSGVGAGDPVEGGVAESRIRVPLLIVPKKLRIYEPDIHLTVRTMDIPATILAQLGLKPFDQVDGADLGGFAERTKTRGYASLLASRVSQGTREPSLELGYRAGQKGTTSMIKLVVRPPDGAPRLFDLGEDPSEATNLADEQPDAVAELRSHALSEARQAEGGVIPPGAAPAAIIRVLRHHRFGPQTPMPVPTP
jgi:hypothetical protein